jgi:hypothetical protein
MPTNVVKTPEDERLWQKAKARAKEQGKAENYAYIMGIYKQMNPGRFASVQRVAARYAAASPDMDALSRAIDDLSDGLADIMDHHALQWRDTPGLAKANSDIGHALSAYQSELEKFYSQEHARLEEEREQERLEQERLERARQEKERQKKERHDTSKKLERLADKVFKDWVPSPTEGNLDLHGKVTYLYSTAPGRLPAVLKAVKEYMAGAKKLLGGTPNTSNNAPAKGRKGGFIHAFLTNRSGARMFYIEIHADIHPVERDGSSMADLTLWISRERDPVTGRHP